MGRYCLISVLLLLFVASSGSEDPFEDATASVEAIMPGTTLHLPSTDSPSAKQLEVVTPASSAAPGVKSVPVAMAEVFTSHEPMTMSNSFNSVASTVTIMKDVEVTSESLTMTPTAGLTNPSTAFKAADMATSSSTGLTNSSTTSKASDMATISSKDEVDGSESPTVDHDSTNPSITHTETESRGNETYGSPDVTDNGSDSGSRDLSNTEGPGQETDKDGTTQEKEKPNDKKLKQEKAKVIIIGVIIFVLIFLLALVVIFMLRKKKRSGSFRTQSKKNARQDVWAGQVPELGDGKAAQDPNLVENGTARTEAEMVNEQEMVTFVTGEKKGDSVVEMNELGSGGKAEANGGENLGNVDTVEEKTPLLEESPEASPKPDDTAEQFPVPPMEQELMANGIQ